ncbi:MAG: T9SS C-terminal target domain-containing protein, partial [Fibrobacter sp.]|nr:T9SS C-terminal target domain-containing protein [Fibrobacter sp.]
MNKKLTIASALLAASAAFAGLDDGVFELWLGSEGAFQVLTGIGNESETAGYWFSYDDSGDQGGSKVVWADGTVELGNGDSPDALDNVILWCNGVCGKAVLDKGKLSYNPFVGIGFNVVGEKAKGEGNPQPGDASAWGGVCITYESDVAPALELGLGDEVDASIEFANPAASLPKASAGTMKQLVWTDFKQPSWYKGKTKIDGATAAGQLVALKFKIQAQSGEYGFDICAIGPNGAA